MGSLAALTAAGWSLNKDALDEVSEEFELTEKDVYDSICDQDLKRVGAPNPGLPDDVNRAQSGSIKGPVVLQIQAIRDITKSSTAISGSGPRMLSLKLTDGKVCRVGNNEHCLCFAVHGLHGTVRSTPLHASVVCCAASHCIQVRVCDLSLPWAHSQHTSPSSSSI